MMTLQRKHIKTRLGTMILAASEQGLAGIWFEGQQHLPDVEAWSKVRKHDVLDQAQEELEAYFKGTLQHFDTPRTAAWGTAFQRAVWETLMTIPYGQTSTYAEIARKLNNPSAVRAVGGAVARNPWSIITPCHRVIGSSGSLTGYAGGLERKIELLSHEGVLL